MEQRLTPEERLELVAFLDHEADMATTAKLETKIAASPTARREVELLQRTWDLLELLPMPKTDEGFTARTVKMTTIELEQPDQLGDAVQAASRSLAVTAACLALFAAAGLGSYFLVRQWPDPSRRLIDDLPVLRRYDDYRVARDIKFLRTIRDLKLLEQSGDAAATGRETPTR